MTQRGRFVAYLVALHVLLAAVGVFLLRQHPLWLFAVELVFIASLIIGVGLTRSIFRDVTFAGTAMQLIEDQELTSRFLPVGQPEIDRLIALYNRMVDSLRDERVRLQEQHHFLSHILRVSPSGVLILDFDGRVTTTNPAAERLLGRNLDSVRGMHLGELGSPLGDAIARLPPDATEVINIVGARRLRCHHGTFLDRGFPRTFVLIEELTEELRQAERGAYEKLIRVMAHEVNNSVTASNSLLHSCLTYSNQLSDATRPDFEQALAVVIERTAQLNSFMRSFATVFRLPAPVKRRERLAELLRANVRLVSARPEAAGIRWRWHIDEPDLQVAIDRAQLEQVVVNVLQNAVDAAGPSGTVHIHLSTRDGRPQLAIEDSGPGISDEVQANLFTPFFSTKPNGQGIGLTVVQEVLAAHGFDYSLEHPPGGPTRFTILFR